MTKTFTSAKKVLPNCWIFWDKIKTCSSGQVFYMDKPLWGLRVQAPVARSGPGSGLRRCFPVFPKVDAASPRGLMAPPGLSALGAKGSACDRLTPYRRVEGSALGSYIVSLRWRGTAPSAPFLMPPLAAKTIQPPCGRGNASPFGGWRHHLSPSSRGHYGCLAMGPCLYRKA